MTVDKIIHKTTFKKALVENAGAFFVEWKRGIKYGKTKNNILS